jgi:isocitrate/isopropylmalate dehydrogenase
MERAMTATLANVAARTGDIRGKGSTASMTAAVIEAIRA